MSKIKVNRIQCLKCKDVIESKHIHDFVTCKCGRVSVDGGPEYPKRSFKGITPEQCFEDLSEYELNNG